ncbi:hypothetical protein BDN72DRAFT_903002 [Pluteus cervinus]|uniref:Uncharacterized protein n=1 Tax=Pluteus cervinus TaxID=181527 RepID=A0ACD3AAR0_9AGAR|nr:hypothetical protein BDN72DRAFT_903002 [Pluteus cervinus]
MPRALIWYVILKITGSLDEACLTLPDAAKDGGRAAKCAAFLWSQPSAVFHYATGWTNDPISSGPGGLMFSGVSSASGLEAHVAPAKYDACRSK